MDANDLRALQGPLKERYKQEPAAAAGDAEGARARRRGEDSPARSRTGRALAVAGLHPATGGTGAELCSGDMLLEALVACAGVTLKAVATALEVPLRDAVVRAEGDLDFRGNPGRRSDGAGRLPRRSADDRSRHRCASRQDRRAPSN